MYFLTLILGICIIYSSIIICIPLIKRSGKEAIQQSLSTFALISGIIGGALVIFGSILKLTNL